MKFRIILAIINRLFFNPLSYYSYNSIRNIVDLNVIIQQIFFESRLIIGRIIHFVEMRKKVTSSFGEHVWKRRKRKKEEEAKGKSV